MSVRAAEARARKEAQEKVRKEHLKVDPKLLSLEEKLSSSLKARVAIETAQDGNSGRLVINYFNPDELNNLIKIMGQVTGDSTLHGLEFTPKTNVLTAEQTIKTDSGFALNTGFLDEVSVDDDKGELLAREEQGTLSPAKFGFDGTSEMATVAELETVAYTPSVIEESLVVDTISDNPGKHITSVEVAPTELTPVQKTFTAASDDGFVSLSDLLARVKAAENPLDAGSVEAYEREDDASAEGDDVDDVSAVPVQEFESQIEVTTISDAELERQFTPAAAASTTSPDLYSALFNM